jgi:hypothetical protein
MVKAEHHRGGVHRLVFAVNDGSIAAARGDGFSRTCRAKFEVLRQSEAEWVNLCLSHNHACQHGYTSGGADSWHRRSAREHICLRVISTRRHAHCIDGGFSTRVNYEYPRSSHVSTRRPQSCHERLAQIPPVTLGTPTVRHEDGAPSAAWTPSECCSPRASGHLRVACQRR